MKAHFLQHVPFEGLGSIEPWLRDRGVEFATTRLFLHERLPAAGPDDFIIAGPGPMSANDERELPWLREEKRFLREAIERGAPVLGVCLGAQLIASCLGARVYPNAQREIGWFPIQAERTPAHCFQFPAECTVFHWHGETFDLPENAVRLVRSPACANQGFQVGGRVIGLQFHLETTPQSAALLIEHSRPEMTPGPYVQSEAVIRAAPAARYTAINALMNAVLEYLAPGGSS